MESPLMRNAPLWLLAALLVSLVTVPGAGIDDAAAQKIVCWKDKAGKVVGCGDSVPLEYQDSATKELDKRGITRKTTETAEERAKRGAQEKELSAQKAEEKKRLAEQSRQDAALINTFTNANEIDLKRDRDLQVVDSQLATLRISHKSVAARQADAKNRMEAAAKTKGGKPGPDAAKDDMTRADADMKKLEQDIANKEKEKEDVRKRYAEMKKRYIMLSGGGTPAAAPAAPAAKK
jgi:hypothetical protein